jgi:DNA-binding MarR family transcriptional regulator
MDSRPLHALLSQLFVAFTVELDGEFERKMGLAGHPGARLSLSLWTGLIRFLTEPPAAIRDLAIAAALPKTAVTNQLACLERWGVIAFAPGRREGWGSGRGLRGDSVPRLTPMGRAAVELWPPLIAEIEARWQRRFGEQRILRLMESLNRIAPAPDLPRAFSGALGKFQEEFERVSPVPLMYCANPLRVLSGEPVPESAIPRLTGCSPETSGIGWQIKPFIVVAPDPAARRGKVVWLSPRGHIVQQAYHRLTAEIEQRWERQYQLRDLLLAFFPKLAEGLTPPPGTARAGYQAPALGRRDIGAAARQRMRDLVAQTEAFLNDPAGALPHFPMWDMNRGFGP